MILKIDFYYTVLCILGSYKIIIINLYLDCTWFQYKSELSSKK